MHRLSEVDAEARTAVCASCGPVKIKRASPSSGGSWRCRTPYDVARKRDRELRRRPYLAHRGDVCERCGFVPEHSCQLDVDHRDQDPSNNDPSNLQTLCANCHRLKTWRERQPVG